MHNTQKKTGKREKNHSLTKYCTPCTYCLSTTNNKPTPRFILFMFDSMCRRE